MRSDEDRSGRPRTPGPRQPDLGHAGATEEIRCHTLEFAAVGPAFGNRLRHGGCGATTESSPGAPRRSNSPPIPNWSPRSPTSSGFTWIPENAIVLPAARTRTSGPACGNNTSPPQRTPFPDVCRPTQRVNPHRPAPSRCGRSNPVRGVGDESAGLRDVPVAPTARQRRARAAGRPKGCAPRHGRHNPVVGISRLMSNST